MVTAPASATGRFRRFRWVVAVSLCLFFLWTANPWHYYFLNDDFLAIPRVADGQFIYGDLLRPVSDLTLWLDHFVWGKDPAGYHLTNLLIHVLNATLVFRLSCELFGRFGDKGQNVTIKSWLALLLFLLYSSHSEPLFWIIGRGGSLCTLFFLVCCISFLRRERSPWYLLACIISFLLGLFVYEAIWVFPLIAALLTLAERLTGRHPGSEKGKWTPIVWMAGIFLLYLGTRWWLTGHIAGAYELRDLAGGRPGLLLYNYGTLLGRCLLPPMADGKWFAGCCLLILLVLAIGIWVARRKEKGAILPGLLGLGLLLALLPAIGLGIDTHTTESERFIYLPSVFWVLLLVELLSVLIPRPGLFLRVGIIVVLVNGYGLWRASLSYRFAGQVVERSLSCIGAGGPIEEAGVVRMPNAGREDSSVLYARGLPSQYEGALIFRRGFEEAVHWILPGYQHIAVLVLSRTTLRERRDEFTCEESDPFRGLQRMHAVNLNLIPPTPKNPGGEFLVDLGDTSFSFDPGKDRVIYWTDSSILRFGR
jgi:hypothetical protein